MASMMLVRSLIALAAVLSLLPHAEVLWACETPVYRYAMYRWQPAPYEVYFFHNAPPDEPHRRVAELLEQYGRRDQTAANVAYQSVNVAEDQELATVPPDVQRAWRERGDQSLPIYYLATPYGAPLGFEQLDENSVETLVDSPARKSLAAQLELGKLGVFVMLSGKDEAENTSAEAVLNGLVEEVRQGKLSLYVSPTQAAAVTEGEAASPSFELGFIQIDRDNHEERWLVQSFLAMEPELADEERPLVFLVYGRARALLPYIGAGITRENLIREIEFISGACSCTVKEQNPGVDLLVRYDWESAASMLAARFGAEEGNEQRFGPQQFFPDLIIPGNAPSTDLASTEAAETGPEEAEQARSEESPAEPISAELPAAGQEPEAPTDVAALTPPAVGAVSAATVADHSSAAATNMVWIVGAGIAVALVTLFGLTFVVLRPR